MNDWYEKKGHKQVKRYSKYPGPSRVHLIYLSSFVILLLGTKNEDEDSCPVKGLIKSK